MNTILNALKFLGISVMALTLPLCTIDSVTYPILFGLGLVVYLFSKCFDTFNY